jgi:hydroxymethylbilane synthase
VPVAAYAEMHGNVLRLTGWVGDAAHIRSITASAEGAADQPEALGQAVADRLFAQGAAELLQLQ